MTPETASALACIADFLFFSWLMMLVRRRRNHRALRYGSIGLFDTYAQVLGNRPGVPITGSPAWLTASTHEPSSK
jgi:hypothetical protein